MSYAVEFRWPDSDRWTYVMDGAGENIERHATREAAGRAAFGWNRSGPEEAAEKWDGGSLYVTECSSMEVTSIREDDVE